MSFSIFSHTEYDIYTNMDSYNLIDISNLYLVSFDRFYLASRLKSNASVTQAFVCQRTPTYEDMYENADV